MYFMCVPNFNFLSKCTLKNFFNSELLNTALDIPIHRDSMYSKATDIIAAGNGKIVWKHGVNRLFYTLMLRTKLY